MGGDPLTWWRRFAFESGSCYSDDAPTSYSPSPMEFNLSLNPAFGSGAEHIPAIVYSHSHS